MVEAVEAAAVLVYGGVSRVGGLLVCGCTGCCGFDSTTGDLYRACDWNDVVVLDGLDMAGGLISWVEDGVAWLDGLEGECTTYDSSVLYAFKHAATRLR